MEGNRFRYLLLTAFFTAAIFAISSFASGSTADIQAQGNIKIDYLSYMPFLSTRPDISNCRYGVTIRKQAQDVLWLATIGTGHYINFSTKPNPLAPLNSQFMFQIRIRQDREDGVYLPHVFISPPLNMNDGGLGKIVQANPGRLWLVGNEPDVANPVQDNILPSTYAYAYHDVYHFIKSVDPTAQVAIAGMSMFTPGREEYLEIVWNTYWKAFGTGMPVDVWNIHLYILSEIRPWDGGNSDGKVALGTNPALALKAPSGDQPQLQCPRDDVVCRAEHDDIGIFKEQLIAMRTWMKAHKQQDKPLILTEFSLLYPFLDYDDPINPTQCFLRDEFGGCFTQQRVSDYMEKTLDFLEGYKDPNLGYPEDDYHLVQQWTWYSMWTEGESAGSSSNLLRDSYPNYEPGAEGALTQVGETYRQRILESDHRVNLVAGKAANVTVKASHPGEKVNAQIALDFYNNGAVAITDPVVVTFFRDQALKDVIGGIAVIPEDDGIIPGCSWGQPTHSASLIWADLPAGTHRYWAKVDPDNKIKPEVSEQDNLLSGTVTVLP